MSIYLSAGELASLYHLPDETVVIPGLRRLHQTMVPLPVEILSAHGPDIGTVRQYGQDAVARIPDHVFPQGPMAVIGQSGVGKSVFIARLLLNQMAGSDRPAALVIDPHDLATDIALRVPATRVDDVIYLNLADTEHPIPLGFFAAGTCAPMDLQVQSTVSVLRQLISQSYWGPRLDDLTYAYVAASCATGLTLLDASRLFTDAAFRRRVIGQLKDPIALSFWGEYNALSTGAQNESTRALRSRLRQGLRTPAVRNLLCQSRCLDFGALLDAGKVLLVKVAGAAIQAEADWLQELVLTRCSVALLSRLDRRPSERRRCLLAVDESQRLAGSTLALTVREIRKVGVAPAIVATQYLDAWSDAMSTAVLGNAACLISFRVGPADARRLSNTMAPFGAAELEALGPHDAIAKLRGLPAFRFTSRPLDVPPSEALLERIQSQTRSRYAHPRAQVEAELWPEQVASTSPIVEDIDEE